MINISFLFFKELNEEGIYRKNGVSHKINQFIERNFSNISQSMVDNNHQQANGHNQDSATNKSLHLSHSSSSSTLSLITNNNNNTNHSNLLQNHTSNNTTTEVMTLNQLAAMTLPSTPILTGSSSNISRNNSNLNLANSSNNNNNNSLESDDTCTITSALKHYLIHLKEPLMTYSYNQQFLNTCSKLTVSF